MDRDSARSEIRRRYDCRRLLVRSKYGMYVCPNCHSGTGEEQTGALKYYPKENLCFCFNCRGGEKRSKGDNEPREGGKQFDAIDIYMYQTGTDYNTALEEMARELGIEIDKRPERAHERAGSARSRETEEGGIIEHAAETGRRMAPQAADGQGDNARGYLEYYKVCADRLTDPRAVEYLTRRGISIETARKCGVGFDPEADPANAPGAIGDAGKKHPCPRLILPTSVTHYVGRRTDGAKEYAKLNAAGSTPGIFNADALSQEAQKVFVVEGAFDALSVIEVGGAAVALNSASNGAALINIIAERGTAASLVLCPDNDWDEGTAEIVRGRFSELAADLQRGGYSCFIADINGGHKDANEYLTEDRSGFMATIADIISGRELTMDAGQDTSTASTVDYFLRNGAFDTPKTKIATGFVNIDSNMGGLYEGLYVLSAAPSIGKTTFALQLADQMAGCGTDCIFFAFEQSKIELVSKSIARFSAIPGEGGPQGPSALEIREGECTDVIRRAARAYRDTVKNHIHIIEGNADYNVLKIAQTVRNHIQTHGGRPVVIIDYLQIIPRTDEAKRSDMRGNVDITVTELRRLAREYHITVFVISSVSRENYNAPSSIDEYKESGGIEYSADAAFSMNLSIAENITDRDKKIDALKKIQNAKAESPREITITVLKGRYTQPGTRFEFSYYPKSDLFIEEKRADAKRADAAGWDDVPLA